MIGVSKAQATCGLKSTTAPIAQDEISIDKFSFVRKVKPTFWGFNMDLIIFQNDFWNSEARRVRPELYEWLHAFPQAVYRYPGGTISNYFQWKESVGAHKERLPQKLVSYGDAHSVDFGFDEYMEFVREAAGTPWVSVNLHGDYFKEQEMKELSNSSAQWAKYARENYPELPVYRWELGNENYYTWSPQKYVSRASDTVSEMTKSNSGGHYVSILEDYRSTPYFPGISLNEYNSYVAQGLGNDVTEYSLHQYFESINAVQQRLSYICQTIDTLSRINPNSKIGIWITETGRWPPGEKEKNWSDGWWRTGSLEAAIAVADYFIGTVQIPEVNGLVVHTLAGNSGPWSMFHIDKDGQMHPSVVFLTLKLLRESYRENVLLTRAFTQTGRKDISAVAFSNKSRTRFALWATNSSGEVKRLALSFKGQGGKKIKGVLRYLSDRDINATNREQHDSVLPQKHSVKIQLSRNGKGVLELPSNSIAVLDFSFVVKSK
jgi:alpha-L-arabinofuranosidase